MKLKTAIESYIRYKQSLGSDFDASGQLLWRYWRILGDIDVSELSTEATKSFIFGTGSVTSTLHLKFHTLRGLVRYMLSRNYISCSPLPTDIPKRPREFVPHIYTREELRKILLATEIESQRYGLDSQTLRTLIILLYGCGLRLGEALRLTLAEVDLSRDVLTICDTKFHKTRYVPFGAGVRESLKTQLRSRSANGHSTSPESRLLLTKRSLPISIELANRSFKRLCRFATVKRERPPQNAPRLHDLRHTFAVHRLTACYEEGRDPQTLLIKLSTYLGHVSIVSTQVYLTMTPQLLRLASERFETYAGKNENGGTND